MSARRRIRTHNSTAISGAAVAPVLPSDSDVFLTDHGILNIDDGTLIWSNFRPNDADFGTIDISGSDTLVWDSFTNSQGSVDIALSGLSLSGTINVDYGVEISGGQLIWDNANFGPYGVIDISGIDLLTWQNANFGDYGTPSVSGDSILDIDNAGFGSFGEVNVSGGQLIWESANFGSYGTNNEESSLGLIYMFLYGTQITNTGFNNPNNASGVPNNVFADSSTDTSDDILDVKSGPNVIISGIKNTHIFTQMMWSYQTNQGGLLALAGEQYKGEIQIGGATIDTVFEDGDGVLTVPAGEEFGQTNFGGQLSIINDDRVSILNTQVGVTAESVINNSINRFTHGKRAISNQGDLSVDAITYFLTYIPLSETALSVILDRGENM